MLFRRDIEPSCSYCLHGTGLGRGEVICAYRGIMSSGGHCGVFRHEPTKRVPEYQSSLNLANITEEDFMI